MSCGVPVHQPPLPEWREQQRRALERLNDHERAIWQAGFTAGRASAEPLIRRLQRTQRSRNE